MLIGSAGGGGGRPHLEWTIDLYRELCRERGYRFRTAVIGAEVDRGWLRRPGGGRPGAPARPRPRADRRRRRSGHPHRGPDGRRALPRRARRGRGGRHRRPRLRRRGHRGLPDPRGPDDPASRSTWARSSSAAARPPIRGTARTACSASSRRTPSRSSRRTRTRCARWPRWPRTRSTSAPIPTSCTCPTATSISGTRASRPRAIGRCASGTRFVPAATPTLKLEGRPRRLPYPRHRGSARARAHRQPRRLPRQRAHARGRHLSRRLPAHVPRLRTRRGHGPARAGTRQPAARDRADHRGDRRRRGDLRRGACPRVLGGAPRHLPRPPGDRGQPRLPVLCPRTSARSRPTSSRSTTWWRSRIRARCSAWRCSRADPGRRARRGGAARAQRSSAIALLPCPCQPRDAIR